MRGNALLEATVAFLVLGAGLSATAGVLFRDTFNAGSSSTDVNLNYTGGRQAGGAIGTRTYTTAGGNDWQQIWADANGGVLFVGANGRNDFGFASPNENFTYAHAATGYFYIVAEFNPNAVDDGGNTAPVMSDWSAFRFGTSSADRNKFVNDSSVGFGVLVTRNLAWAAFNSSTSVGGGPVGSMPSGMLRIEFRISDSADNNPFNGSASPILIQGFANGSPTPFLSYTRSTNFSNNYLTLQAYMTGTGKGEDYRGATYDSLELGTDTPPPVGTVLTLR